MRIPLRIKAWFWLGYHFPSVVDWHARRCSKRDSALMLLYCHELTRER